MMMIIGPEDVAVVVVVVAADRLAGVVLVVGVGNEMVVEMREWTEDGWGTWECSLGRVLGPW